MIKHTDILIVGCGVAGLFAALHLPKDKKITIITKDTAKHSDSYLAQGGICVLKNEEDYQSYFEDTMKAGHYENRKESVELMIRNSAHVIHELETFGVHFEHNGEEYLYTREGGHSTQRILFHKDRTGREITSKLLDAVRGRKNIELLEKHTLMDLWIADQQCCGGVILPEDAAVYAMHADYTILASGGIGGLFTHSTNYRHLTGDALAIALKHGIRLEHVDYIQIHPTTLYSEKPGRRFLISESVRGEGAILLDKDGNRFVNELLPRDLLTKEVYKQMEKDQMPYVRLSLKPIPEEEIMGHFPHIYKKCLEAGYDITKEPIPVVPAQHYFMGGIWVNSMSKTSMERLYAAGETSCNGVHGKNRLASNSLLESLVFAERAADDLSKNYEALEDAEEIPNMTTEVEHEKYRDPEKIKREYKKLVLDKIKEMEEQTKKRMSDPNDRS